MSRAAGKGGAGTDSEKSAVNFPEHMGRRVKEGGNEEGRKIRGTGNESGERKGKRPGKRRKRAFFAGGKAKTVDFFSLCLYNRRENSARPFCRAKRAGRQNAALCPRKSQPGCRAT